MARDWLTVVHSAKVSAGHAERTRIRFEQDVFPWLGARLVGEIDAPELLACLRRMLARGTVETAHRIKDACGQVLRYAIASGLAKIVDADQDRQGRQGPHAGGRRHRPQRHPQGRQGGAG